MRASVSVENGWRGRSLKVRVTIGGHKLYLAEEFDDNGGRKDWSEVVKEANAAARKIRKKLKDHGFE
jgi:hypothetical protein